MVHLEHSSFLRKGSGSSDQPFADIKNSTPTVLQTVVEDTSGRDFVEEAASDSDDSYEGFTPKQMSPVSSGRVSPVPKLVLPKQVFRDHSPKAGRSGGSNNGKMTTKAWAATQEQFSHLPQLQQGWIRVRSRTTGAIYYCFTETGETTYEEPRLLTDSTLPPPWHEKVSRSTGKTYYWNSQTNQSQYEHPASVPPAQNDGDKLPLGWRRLKSRRTGRTYYFNDKLNLSQFEYPGEEPRTPTAQTPHSEKSTNLTTQPAKEQDMLSTPRP